MDACDTLQTLSDGESLAARVAFRTTLPARPSRFAAPAVPLRSETLALLARRTEELTASLEVIESTHRHVLHLERLGTMGRLAAGITHDLRNVMISVNFIERELQQQNASPDLLESVHVGTQGIHNLLETLEAMHQFASAGTIHLAMDKVAPAQVVQGAIAISRMDLNYRARKVDVQVQDDLPCVNGDRQKLIQVLVNLVRNALQATERSRRISIDRSTKTAARAACASMPVRRMPWTRRITWLPSAASRT